MSHGLPTPQRRATDHPEVVKERRYNGHGHGRLLIIAATCTGILLVAVFGARTVANAKRDIELCRDLDRFAVGFEEFIVPNPDAPPETQDRIEDFRLFLEDFRKDLDCRTV